MVAGPASYWTTTMNDRVLFKPERVDGFYQHRRLLFHYYKDRYAAMLLENILQPRLSLRCLREGRYGRLLDRPALKALADTKGDGWLDRHDLLALWPSEVETYVLSFGTWGAKKRHERRWNQTSRPGRQLALQLNFSRRHDAEYDRLIFKAERMPFVSRNDHPVNRSGRNTMAWARIDIDLLSGEALIEEVQNDWIRIVNRRIADAPGRGIFRTPVARQNLEIYARSILAPHAAMWSEAVLAAALHVLIQELGIHRIWFHDFDTGCELKKLTVGRKPPRSLYTDLPKRFCFERTDEPPEFILPVQTKRMRLKLERRQGRFWRLDAQPLAAPAHGVFARCCFSRATSSGDQSRISVTAIQASI